MLLNKKLIILAIFFVLLLAVSVVSATDNNTSDVVNVEEINYELSSDVDETTVSNEIQNDELITIKIPETVETDENENILSLNNYDNKIICDENNIDDNLSASSSEANVDMTIYKNVRYGGKVATISINKKYFYEINIYVDNSLRFTKQLSNKDYVNNKFSMSFSDKSLGLIPGSYLIEVTFATTWFLKENVCINPLENSPGFNSTLSNGKVIIQNSSLEINMGENVTLDIASPKLNGEIGIYIDNTLFKSVKVTEGHVKEFISNLYAGHHVIRLLYDDGINFYSNSFGVNVNKKSIADFNKLIDQMTPGETLFLNEDNVFDAYEINLNKPLTIDGAGHKWGNNLNVNADDVCIKNFLFLNMNINWFGKRGTIENCTFLGDYNRIKIHGKQTSLINLKFLRTRGSIGSYDIMVNASQIIIEDCLFSENPKTCIYIYDTGTDSSIKNCIFEKNMDKIIDTYAKNTKINNCTFKNNKGMLVYFQSSASSSSISKSIFLENELRGYDALIICNVFYCSITNSIILDCYENEYNKFIYSGYPFNANNNWWGNTNYDFSQVLANVVQKGMINVNRWYYLNISTTPTLNLGSKSIINYEFYDNYYEKSISKMGLDFPKFVIKTMPVNGTSDYSVLIEDGRGQLEFIANNMPTGQLISQYSLFKDIKNLFFEDKGLLYTNDLETSYSTNIIIEAFVKNSEDLPLFNVGVDLNIDENHYYNVTNNNGLVRFNINLPSGHYQMKMTHHETKEFKINKLIINSLSIPDENILIPTLPSSSSESVTVKLPSDASGTITLNIDGKNYKFKVNKGVANINVPELGNGNYLYTITYSGDGKYSSFSKTGSLTVNKPSEQTTPSNTTTSTNQTNSSNTATSTNQTNSSNTATSTNQTTPAKPVTKITLTLKKVKVKRSAKKLTIQATLKVNGKAVKGKIIKFKFNKKSYKARTNAKGVAKITVKKSVLKKLKKGKKVTYTATYGKITKKVTVKVKK